MLVNPKKTKLICLSAATHSEVSSYIPVEGERINSTDKMIVLGYCFGSRPTQSAHIELILSKFCSRSWLFRHLKQSGIPNKDIVSVYTATIRSVIEYASPVYGSMLTQTQSEELKKLQRCILKTSYRRAVEISGFENPGTAPD